MSERPAFTLTTVILLLASVSVFSVVAPPPAVADEEPVIGFALPTLAQWRWKFDKKWFKERADELGARKVITQAANEDEATQTNQVQNMLVQGIDALVIAPVNVSTASTLVNMAREQGVPVVSYNYLISDADLQYFVARDNKFVGEFTAEKALENRPNGNYVIASGDPGTDVAQLWTEGVMEVLEPEVEAGNINVVSQQFHAAWKPSGALKQVENALTKTNNDVDVVLGTYDGFILAVLEPLQEAGLAGETYLAGQDLFERSARLMTEDPPKVHMSAWTDLRDMAHSAAEAAYKLAKGKTPPSNVKKSNGTVEVPGKMIKAFPVTPDSLCGFLQDTGWFPIDEIYTGPRDGECSSK